MIGSGFFSPQNSAKYQALVEALTGGGDRYLVLADFPSYVEIQDKIAEVYRDREAWTRKAVLNVAHMGAFSSDRTINEYARDIWRTAPVGIELKKGD